jgi:putative sterol carrier protein
MSDRLAFPSDVWIKRLMAELNNSHEYQTAARTWEGDLYFVVEPEGSLTTAAYLYMDLWHGQCRQAALVDDPASHDPEFLLSAPLHVWRQIIERQLDPIKAMLTRKLKLEGNMAKIMKHVKAANEMVTCTTRIQTEFPIN